MPITNYRCEDCGKEFTKIFFDAEDEPKACPVCAAPHISRRGEAFPAAPDYATTSGCYSCESCSSCGPTPSS